MLQTLVTGELCTDCTMIVANDDDSGCEDPFAARDALERETTALCAYLEDEGYAQISGWIVTGEDTYFGTQPCDGCGDGTHGDRIEAVVLGTVREIVGL
jgi:hypothetical protein